LCAVEAICSATKYHYLILLVISVDRAKLRVVEWPRISRQPIESRELADAPSLSSQ